MTLTAHTVNSAEEMGEAAWNALSAGRPFQSYQWYRFGETVMANAKPNHVILSEGRQAIGRASFWRICDEPLAPGLMANFLKYWLLLVCRSPFSSTAGGDSAEFL